jgi:hypothetical protein
MFCGHEKAKQPDLMNGGYSAGPVEIAYYHYHFPIFGWNIVYFNGWLVFT